ncbi:BrnT family toxin [Pseudorhodoferax sp. Leaf267]|uniref:BrnT family toxin n=1 Tax=Pseudorhodoferax sp. Leaf267 TaxID=1736316 RepID=UPI00268039EB
MAKRIAWADVLCFPDSRQDYGELREIGFAVVDDRLYVVVFVQRGEVMRIISLRKANAREVNLYDQAFQEHGARDSEP